MTHNTAQFYIYLSLSSQYDELMHTWKYKEKKIVCVKLNIIVPRCMMVVLSQRYDSLGLVNSINQLVISIGTKIKIRSLTCWVVIN